MTDKELIKQEIEGTLNGLFDYIPSASKVLYNDFTKDEAVVLGKYKALEDILKFIDSLPEEPALKEITWKDVNILDTLINQVRHEFPNGISEKSFGLAVLEKFQDYQDDIEEPVSEDLEDVLPGRRL